MNLSQLHRTQRDPAIQDYLQADAELRRIKHKRRSKLPYVAGGLAATGAGLVWAGNKVMTSEDRAKLDNLTSLSTRMDKKNIGMISASPNADFAGTSQLFYDYIDRASQGASAKIYGQPVREVIEKLRKSPLLSNTVFDMRKASPWSLVQTDDHYRDFEAGPLAAYMHQMQKHDEAFGSSGGMDISYMGTKPGAEAKAYANAIEFSDRLPGMKHLRMSGLKRLAQHIEDKGPLETPKYPDIMSRGASPQAIGELLEKLHQRKSGPLDTYHELRTKIDARMPEFLKEEGVLKPGEEGKDIREISAALPHGREMDLLQKFRGWVGSKDPEVDKVLKRVEPLMSDGMAGPARFYAFGGNLGAKLLQDTPRILGAAAIAASAGIGAGWLWGRIREKQKKKELREKKRLATTRLTQMNMPKAASTYPGYLNHNVQQLLPISGRRELTPTEMLQAAEGRDQWMPKIFESLNDSPTVNLASPGKQSLLWGAGVGVPMALSAAANSGSTMAGVGTGVMTGGLAAALAYYLRRQKNEDIEETMRRLPEGANLRDFQADPLMAERRRMSHERSLNLASRYR